MGRMEFIERVARICHEANRAYCHTLGDRSQKEWDLAPEWQKESARIGVEKILTNPLTTPEELHSSWMDEKIRTGWKYGKVKDPILKEHPCMVPYSLLHEDQRTKDRLFRATVLAFLSEE